jgi:protein disulfide-isomerase
MNKLILFIIFILLLMIFICKRKKITTPIKSGFNANKIMSSDTSSKSDNITNDTTLIFYAPWCGHCKKSMRDFNEAVTKSNGKIILINGDNEPDLVKKYNVKSFPTIMKNNNIYSGQRDASSIVSFAES